MFSLLKQFSLLNILENKFCKKFFISYRKTYSNSPFKCFCTFNFIMEWPQRFRETCYHCRQASHMVWDFFKKHGPPSGACRRTRSTFGNKVGARGRKKNPAATTSTVRPLDTGRVFTTWIDEVSQSTELIKGMSPVSASILCVIWFKSYSFLYLRCMRRLFKTTCVKVTLSISSFYSY